MLALTLVLLAADPVPDELLDRLQAHESRLARIYEDGGFTVRTTVENLDRDGKATSRTEVETQVTYEGGVRREHLVKKIEDGEDVTEEARRKKERDRDGKEEKLESNPLVLPFAKAERPKYRFTRKSRTVIAFTPVVEPSKSVWKGEATIDPDAGTVLEVRAKPAKYPAFVDRLKATLEFDVVTRAGPTPSTLTIEGEGGFLFYRKRVRMVTEFSDYVVPE